MKSRHVLTEVAVSDAQVQKDDVLDAVAAAVGVAKGDCFMPGDVEQRAALEYKGYQALVSRAVDVFGDQTKASLWLSMPNTDLLGKAPLQVAQSLHYDPCEMEKMFESIFIRIEHGIYV